MEKKYFLLTAGGVDRKGIVFNLTKILKKYGFNIEDSSMILLRHTFSVIVILSHSDISNSELKKFHTEINLFMKNANMSAEIRGISQKDMAEYGKEGGTYMLSISGADKPGIVNSITGILYKNKINIIDMETKSSQKTMPAAYYMFLEVDVPKKVKIAALGKELQAAGKKIGVHININKVESDVL